MSTSVAMAIAGREDLDPSRPYADRRGHAYTTLRTAITAIKGRSPVVLVDDVSDPPLGPTGSLVLAAQHADTERMTLLVRETSGFVCVAMTGDRLDNLRVPPLAPNRGRTGIGFAVAVDLGRGLTTGISARDRAMTVRALADPSTQPDDLARPGHVLPVCIAEDGVVGQPGLAEAAVDLCRAAGLRPAAALATVLDAGGEVAGVRELVAVAERLGVPLVRLSVVVTWATAHRPD
jgi:3,4-dihydroxy-2-butanone 4-phosphate synthase